MNAYFSTFSSVFTKMCSAGNDFLITDETRFLKYWNVDQLFQKVPQFCDAKFGLGTDGLCILTRCDSSKEVWNWTFFNKDGSAADMCGNAACCIVQYAFQKSLTQKNSFTFRIKDRVLKGEVIGKNESVLQIEIPKWIQQNISTKVNESNVLMNHIHSGVEHLVIKKDEPLQLDKLRYIAQSLRVQYVNANVTFYFLQDDAIHCASFERGVEDFTLGCGTGALAVAYCVSPESQTPIQIQMPGGKLKVQFIKDQAYLSSVVHFVAEISPIVYKS